MQVHLHEPVIKALVEELKSLGRFTLLQAEELARKYVDSEFSLFVATKAIAKLCQEYKKKHGRSPTVIIGC